VSFCHFFSPALRVSRIRRQPAVGGTAGLLLFDDILLTVAGEGNAQNRKLGRWRGPGIVVTIHGH